MFVSNSDNSCTIGVSSPDSVFIATLIYQHVDTKWFKYFYLFIHLFIHFYSLSCAQLHSDGEQQRSRRLSVLPVPPIGCSRMLRVCSSFLEPRMQPLEQTQVHKGSEERLRRSSPVDI